MSSRQFAKRIHLLLAVTQDAVRLSKARWHREPNAPGAPLAVRLATFQGAMTAELERTFQGLDALPPDAVALLILKGVVEAGEDVDAVQAASGITLG